MKLIVGLGNPGKQYRESRHNVGFMVIKDLCRRWGVEASRRKHQGRVGSMVRNDEQILLLQPQTYMNLSGESVAAAVNFYKVEPVDILVILDDMALELGQLRLRPKGSAGGHNGLNDIIIKLGGDDFARLRIGIGTARGAGAIGHVLGQFEKEEKKIIASAVEKAAEAVECWLTEGIGMAMNKYNVRPETKNEQTEEDN